MIMQILPIYYTTLNTKNRKKFKKPRKFGGHRIKANTSAFQAENESSSLSVRSKAHFKGEENG